MLRLEALLASYVSAVGIRVNQRALDVRGEDET
jgi:hypothetical protein